MSDLLKFLLLVAITAAGGALYSAIGWCDIMLWFGGGC